MKYFTCLFFMFITCTSWAQDYGSLKGVLIEDFSYEPIQYAYLSLKLDGALVTQTRADANGTYFFLNIEAGNYDLIISKLGLSPLKITDVLIVPNKITVLNPSFEARGFDQDTIVFTSSEFHQNPLRPKQKNSKKHCTKRQGSAARKLNK